MANGKRILGTILFFVSLAVTLAFVFLLYADSVNDSQVPLVDQVPQAAFVAGTVLGVIFMLLCLLLIVRGYDKQGAVAEDAEAFFVPDADRDELERARRLAYEEAMSGGTGFLVGGEVEVYNLARVPHLGKPWTRFERRNNCFPFYFPRSVDAAVYTNDYIVIDRKGTRLKLMTLLAGPTGGDQAEIPADRKARWAGTRPVAPPAPPMPSAIETYASPPLMAVAGGGSESFMKELEERLGQSTPSVASPSDVYYDYVGDNHQVEDVEGIGAVYGSRLREIGVQTTGRLCFEDAGRLADRLGIARTTVENWQHMAELMKVKGIGPQFAEAMARAGIKGIADLKKRSAAAIAGQVNGYLDGLEVNVVGQKLTEKRIESWQDAAKGMRRVRMQVPEN